MMPTDTPARRGQIPPAVDQYWVTERLGVITQATGATLTTSNRGRVIDFSSAAFGYNHDAVVSAAAAQMRVLPQSTRMFLNHPLAALVTRLAELLPGDLSVTFPCNSAAEATEGALKLALGYHKRTARTTFLATTGSDHGHTLGAAKVSYIRRHGAHKSPAPVDTHFIAHGDLPSLQAMAQAIKPAAIVVEPIATGEGLSFGDERYLPGVRQTCDRINALMIVNETTTGFGRTGQMFAVHRHDVVPDIMVLGGALGGGILPVGAYVTTKRINDRVYGRRAPWLHGSTTGGSPLACAAAVAAIDVITRERLPQRCGNHGELIAQRLQRLRTHHPTMITRTMAIGHLGAIQWYDPQIARRVAEAALDAGVLLDTNRFAPQWTRLRPPLIACRDEIDAGLAGIEEALSHCDQRAAG